jgi:putative resolvase
MDGENCLHSLLTRLTRLGFKYIETLLAMQGRSIEIVNVTENPIEEIIADFVSILYSFAPGFTGNVERYAR